MPQFHLKFCHLKSLITMPRMFRRPRRTDRRVRRDSTRAIALRALRQVDGELNSIELFDDPVALAVIGVTPATFLNGIAQGSANTQRQGILARMVRIRLRMTFQRNPAADPNQVDFIRWLLVRDTQPQNNLPAIGEILQSSPSANAQTLAYDWQNIDQMKRFKILQQGFLATSVFHPSRIVHVSKKLNFTSLWVGPNATIVDINSNGLFLFTMQASATNPPTFGFHGQLRYRP